MSDKAKWTKGPWAVQDSQDDDGQDVLEIAPIGAPNTAIVTMSVNAESNARLMAAAPDLAEALSEMVEAACRVARHFPKAYSEIISDTLVERAEAALRKAGAL